MIYIALGSNLGNRLTNLRRAIAIIKDKILSQCAESIVIETEALVKPGALQDWNKPYLNMVIAGKSSMNPEEMMLRLKDIEKNLGRDLTSAKWAPRIIDLDILMYNDNILDAPGLSLPHKELLNRSFLLHLLALLPEKFIPYLHVKGKKIRADEYAHKNCNYNNLFSKSFALGVQFAGVLNITPDSFSDGGVNFDPETAIQNAYKMVQDGAEIIDIGAQSTRPGDIEIISPEKEYERLIPVLDGLKALDAKISIDTYRPDLIRKLLGKYKIDWINDVTGNLDGDTLKEVAASGCKIVTMHSFSIPPTKDRVLSYRQNASTQMRIWGEMMLWRMQKHGFSVEDVIIDPGIGFGKSIYQNLSIIRGIQELRIGGAKILIGHSRKSFMSGFSRADVINRDLETAAISCNLAKSGVDFLRVHNVAAHHRLLVASKISA